MYDADVYISIPKLKTHQKVGVTLNLKGLVGSISNKNRRYIGKSAIPEQTAMNTQIKNLTKKAKTPKLLTEELGTETIPYGKWLWIFTWFLKESRENISA